MLLFLLNFLRVWLYLFLLLFSFLLNRPMMPSRYLLHWYSFYNVICFCDVGTNTNYVSRSEIHGGHIYPWIHRGIWDIPWSIMYVIVYNTSLEIYISCGMQHVPRNGATSLISYPFSIHLTLNTTLSQYQCKWHVHK